MICKEYNRNISYLFITGKKSHGSCVAITSTHSSTVAEAIVSLVRTLHALPVWNNVINEAIVERLGLVAQLLSDLSQFQFKVGVSSSMQWMTFVYIY